MAGELIEVGPYRIFAQRRGLGAPLLLVHGVYPGASHEEWTRVISTFAGQFTVYAIDLLGFGESDAPRITYTTRIFHHLLRDLIMTRLDEPAHVIAAGVSCAAATQLAVFDDTLVRSLVLVSPIDQPHEVTLTDRVNHFIYGKLPFGSGQYEAAIDPEALHAFVDDRYADAKHSSKDRYAQIKYNAARPNSAAPFISYLTGFFDLDVYRPLRNVRCPVEVIWGSALGEPPRDRILAPAAWSQGKQLHVIDGAKHWPHEEQSALFSKRVLQFLTDADQARPAIADRMPIS